MIEAIYYDGYSSRAHAVEFSISDGQARVLGEGISRSEALTMLRVSEPMGAAPRLLTFSDGAFCEIRQHEALRQLLAEHGHQDRPVVRWQFNFWRVYGALLITVAVLVSGYVWGLPWLAQTAARHMPEDVVQQLGSVSLENLDKHIFEASKLPLARQEEIRSLITQLRSPMDDDVRPSYRIHFRQGGWIGANALALPSGDIVVTDELVDLADRDEQILGVVAHEMGHVRHRHGLQMLIQGSATGLIAAWLVGDVSSLLATLPTALAQLAYSRQLEADADDYAIATLKANHISPAHLADMLQQLVADRARRNAPVTECRNPQAQSEAQPKDPPTESGPNRPEAPAQEAKTAANASGQSTDGNDEVEGAGLPPYLSSHPVPSERIAKLRQAAQGMDLR